MSNQRKNVIDSIANFQLSDIDETPITELAASKTPKQTSSTTFSAQEKTPDTDEVTIKTGPKIELTPKSLLSAIVVVVVVAIAFLGYFYNKQIVNFSNAMFIAEQQAPAKEQELIALKSDIAILQTTMDSIVADLITLTQTDANNRVKQQEVDLLLAKMAEFTSKQSDYFSSELQQLTDWQIEYQEKQLAYLEQQKRQLANVTIDVDKLSNTANAQNYQQKFSDWQSDVETIKQQQVKIHKVLLELQKEYVKLNQQTRNSG